MNLLPIAITSGEPAGIGPDLVVTIAQKPLPIPFIVVADADLLQQRAQRLNLPLTIQRIDTDFPLTIESGTQPHFPGLLRVRHVSLAEPCVCGLLNPANAEYVLQTLDIAVRGCLEQSFSALVTGPVHKGNINAAGIPFSGHTEYLADKTQVECPVMLLVSDNLRVALVTIHIPLSKVPSAITSDRLKQVLRVIHYDLQKRFGIDQPRLLVCGLNPHAGEGGYLGMEEITTIIPALKALRNEGMLLEGPVPADTAFTPRLLENADVVVAMYHDQGLPVVKYAGFGHAVNVTLGLPIIRTSVDHGTALDLAGTGKADSSSLIAAMEMSIRLLSKLRNSR
jgi:4-hydroxythreonine-4-phosphate dehydrogenase